MTTLVAADGSYPLLDAIWTVFVIFGWLIWFWLLIMVFGDLFRRTDISGWGKAGWAVVVLILPYIGVLIYLIVHGHGMGERRAQENRAAQADVDAYIRNTAHGTPPADQIAKAKELLDQGVITTDEYETLKKKALT